MKPQLYEVLFPKEQKVACIGVRQFWPAYIECYFFIFSTIAIIYMNSQ